MSQDVYQRQLPLASDVPLGVVKIPLQQLLFSHTGKVTTFVKHFSLFSLCFSKLF